MIGGAVSDFLLLGQNGQFWTLALVAVLLMGVSKGGFGSGLNVVSTPLLALASSPALAAAVMLPLLNAMDMLGARDRTQMAVTAMLYGLIDPLS